MPGNIFDKSTTHFLFASDATEVKYIYMCTCFKDKDVAIHCSFIHVDWMTLLQKCICSAVFNIMKNFDFPIFSKSGSFFPVILSNFWSNFAMFLSNISKMSQKMHLQQIISYIYIFSLNFIRRILLCLEIESYYK